MATGGSEFTSDETFDFKCSTCVKLNKNREAVKYCVECQGYCCQSCMDMHSAFPTLVGHTFLDKTSFKSTFLTTDLPEIPTLRCHLHGTKVVDMFCENHDVVGCTTCMTLEHRSCKDVQSIPDVIETVFQKTDVDRTVQKLIETKTTMAQMKKSRDTLLQELFLSKSEAINTIQRYRNEMERRLENLEKESIKQVVKKYGEIESILKQEKSKVENEEGDLKREADNLQKSQQFVYMKTARMKIAETQNVLRSLEAVKDATISFVENNDIRNFLYRTQTLGTVTSRRNATAVSKNTLYSIKGTTDLNIKTSEDVSTCNVTGSCFTDNGLLLLADCNNKKLKRVDIAKLSVVDQCDIPDAPNGVCCTSKQEAAVTLANSTIQFVTLNNRMSCTRQIKLDHAAWGIAYKEDRLYITDYNISLYIHNMAGNLLQTVSKGSSGNALFQYCWHIAFDEDSDTLLVTSCYGLVMLNARGQHVKTYRDTGISNVIGVCTDRRGNVFASSYGSHKLLQIEQGRMKKLGVVAGCSDGVNWPYSVSFDPCRNLLVVTQCGDNSIKLFELK